MVFSIAKSGTNCVVRMSISENLNEIDIRLMNILFSNAYGNIAVKQVHTIAITTIVGSLGLIDAGSWKNIESSLKKLTDTTVKIQFFPYSDVWTSTKLISAVEVEKELCIYEYSNAMLRLLNIPYFYDKLHIYLATNKLTKHSAILLEYLLGTLCVSGKFHSSFDLSVENLKLLFEMNEQHSYNEFKLLNFHVLQPALKEINENTLLEASISTKRASKKISIVSFEVSLKDDCYENMLIYKQWNIGKRA